MKTVREILKKKGSAVWAVGPEDSIYAALNLMAEKNVGAVLVTKNNRLEGIFSERDYARKVILKGKSSRETTVGEAMTANVSCVEPDRSVEECMALMTERRIRHLPVVESGNLAGVVSIGDVVEAKISEQEFIIGQLENYITGGGVA